MKIGAALILTAPYIPMLFQGEEWRSSSPFLYFADFDEEPGLAKAVREGRCREFVAFGWEPEAVPDPNRLETFHASKLHWDELSEKDHQETLARYKSLIALRSSLSALTTGRFDLTNALFNAEHSWLWLERGPARVVCNFSREAIEIPCTADEEYSVLLSSKPDCNMRNNDSYVFRKRCDLRSGFVGNLLQRPPENEAHFS
jgi:maltooligosyltrehalose trehalohydrolase